MPGNTAPDRKHIPKNVPLYPVEPDILRFRLTQMMPYLATAIYRMREVKEEGLGTFATDANWRWYHDVQVPFNPDEQVAALYHEVQHLLRGHMGRKGERDPNQWNLAADCEINDWFPPSLTPSELFIYPSDFSLPNEELAEWYFDRIDQWDVHVRVDATALSPGVGPCKSHGPKCKGDDSAPQITPKGDIKKKGVKHAPVCGGAAGNPREGESGQQRGNDDLPGGVGEIEAEAVRREVARKVEQAAQGRGTVPGSLERWAKELLHPKVRWEKLLKTYTRRASIIISGMTEATYSKPSRREMEPFIMPKRIARKTTAAMYVDTSGSVDDDMLNLAMAEVRGAVRSNAAELTVSFIDTDVKSTKKVSTIGQVKLLVPKGRGGTDMRVCFEHYKTLKPRPNLIIILTDGETPWPNEQPHGVQTIVVLVPSRHYRNTGTSPSWAKTIRIGEESNGS